MKLRESGMPAQEFWETFLVVPLILDAFGFNAAAGDAAERGCGYGTFTIPLARRIRGTVHALNLDLAMVAATHTRDAVRPGGLIAVILWRRDVPTPRGPPLAIRPRPADIVAWATAADLRSLTAPCTLPPWNYGLAPTR